MYTPWPDVWSRLRNRGSFVLTVAILLIGTLLYLAATGFAADDPWRSAALVTFVLPLSFLCAGAYVSAGMCSQRTNGAVTQIQLRSDAVALRLPTLRSTTILLTLAGITLAAGFLTFPVLMDHVPVSGTWRDARLRASAPFMPLAGVAMLGWSLARVVRKRSELGVGLSPEGVYHWAWLGCCFYSWDWIKSVHATGRHVPHVDLHVAEPSVRPVNAEENWLAQLDSHRRKCTKLMTHHLAVNPGAAYIALVFYHRHPELRHELSGEAAVTRIQKMDFPELIKEIEDHGALRPTPE